MHVVKRDPGSKLHEKANGAWMMATDLAIFGASGIC